MPGSSCRERKETGISREDGGESRQDTKKPAASGGLVRLRGIEPPHPAPEAGALSTELQAHMKLRSLVYHTFSKMKSIFLENCKTFSKKNH